MPDGGALLGNGNEASTVLGFTLIVIGLTLLTLVGIGFFTSAH